MAAQRVVVAMGVVVAAALLLSRHRSHAPSVTPARAVDSASVPRARVVDVPRALRLELPPLRRAVRSSGPARIAGIVREHGVPVAEATIWMRQLPQPGRTPSSSEPKNSEGPTTDEHGRFWLDNLPPGELAIWAVHGGRSSSLLQPLSLSAGEQLAGVDLELTGSSIAEGIVVDARGEQSMAEVTVSVAGLELEDSDTVPGTPFLFESLPDDPITLVARVTSEEDSDVDREAKVTLPHAQKSIVLRLHDKAPDLLVEVVDESGAVDDGALVYLFAGDSSMSAMTNEAGVASFVRRTGKVSIVASDDSRELAADPVEVELEDGQSRTLRVVLHPTTCASGRVLDADGHPAAGMVELTTLSNSLTELMMLDEGTYRFCIGRRGSYTLRYSPDPGGSRANATFGDVTLDVDLTPGTTTLRDVRLPAPRSVRVLLVDGEGAPTRGYVKIESSDGKAQAGFRPTDGSGVAVVSLLGPVQVRAIGLSTESEPVRAPDSGGDMTLTLTSFADVQVLLRGAPPGTVVRCGTQPWQALASTALADLSCHAGDTLEAMVGDVQRRFSVPVDMEETSYTELRWD